MADPKPKSTLSPEDIWKAALEKYSPQNGVPSGPTGKVAIPGWGKNSADAEYQSAQDMKDLFVRLQYNNGKKTPSKRLTDWMKSVGVTNIKVAQEIWNDAANYAFKIAKNGSTVNFFDVISSQGFAQTGLDIPKKLTKTASSGPDVQKYVSITDARNARENLRKTMMSTLNRMPTEEEYNDYVAQLNANEKKYFRQTEYLADGTQRVTGVEFDRDAFLTKFVLSKVDFGNNIEGAAGTVQDTVTQMINDNGLQGYVSANKARNWMAQLLAGKITTEQLQSNIRNQAGVVYSAFKPLLDENPTMSLTDVATPYLKTYADMLEVTGPFEIKDALSKASTMTDKGVQGLMSIFDYEKALRKDQRFQYTKKAANEASSLAASFARSFGVSI